MLVVLLVSVVIGELLLCYFALGRFSLFLKKHYRSTRRIIFKKQDPWIRQDEEQKNNHENW